MLAAMVAAGELPPLEERLPANPLVLDPVEELGEYGGTWHLVDSGDSLGWTRQTMMVEPFLKWKRDTSGSRPNLLEDWEWNDDATELVVNFRQGIKWSDGEPLTVDDYLFWWNDMVLDEDIPVGAPGGTTVGGEPMTVEKVDDFTLKYTFAAPESALPGKPLTRPLPLIRLCGSGPLHETVPPQVQHGGGITGRFGQSFRRGSRLHYPDMPTYMPWKLVDFKSGQSATFERNPYYWKVDPEGRQLPYIDMLEVDIAEGGGGTELVALKAIAGELDMQVRDLDLKDIPLVMENAENGDYRVIMWNRGDYAWPWLILMYDYPDEAIVDLMYSPEFRRGLSLCDQP